MATLRERTTLSVYHVLFVFQLFVILVISHFGFEGETLVLIALFPGHCLPFTLYGCKITVYFLSILSNAQFMSKRRPDTMAKY